MAIALESVVKQLTDSGIVAPGKLENLVPPKASPKDGEELLRELYKQNLLTKFQAQQVAAGKAKALILGNYVLLDKIGAGGMGQVFKAEHRRLERLVAIKMLPPAMTKDAAAVARFQREVKAAAKLRHPNIVATDDADEANGAHFLVMECIDGQDLSVLVKKNGPLPVAKAVNCILQAARGLEFAHGEGVVHRDIKPSNLLLDKKGTVKILDMGLARISSDGNAATQAELTGTGAVMGTIDYMAPEQALDTKTADARADIYSLGCSLFYLLTGKATYDGETLTAKLLAHQTQPIPDLRKIRPDVPEEVEAVFRKMLAKKVEDRYQSMTEVMADLERCTTSQSTSLGRQPFAITNASNDTLTFHQHALAEPTLPIATANKKVPAVQAAGGKNKKFIYGAVGAACLGALLLAAIMFFVQTKNGTIRVEINDPEIQVTIQGTEIVLKQADKDKDITLSPGDHTLLVRRGDFTFETKNLVLKKGDAVTVNVELSAGQVEVRQGERLLGSQRIPSSPALEPRPSVAGGWHGWPADAPKPAIAPFDAAQARKHQEEWAAYLKVPVEWENSIGMKFRLIPPGEYLRGSSAQEQDAVCQTGDQNEQSEKTAHLRNETPQHRVTITQPVYVAIYELTQAEYEKVMGTNPSAFSTNGTAAARVSGIVTERNPVEMVNWHDAKEYCRKLGELEGYPEYFMQGGKVVTPGYRLPSEAEWEFACRAGTTTQFWNGDSEESLLEGAWFAKNAQGVTHPVGLLKPNPFGLFDMHGNVRELSLDGSGGRTTYDHFANLEVVDPIGPVNATHDVFRRGGGIWSPAWSSRSAIRGLGPSDLKGDHGIRLAFSVEGVKNALRKETQGEKKSTWHGWPADAPKPAIAPFDAAQAKKHQEEWATYLNVPVEHENTLGMKFVLIPPGEFTMGSTAAEIEEALKFSGEDKHWQECIKSEAPQHKAILTQPLYLSVHEVTQAQFEKVMGQNPSHFAPMGVGKDAVVGLDTSSSPVEMVSWNDAAEFCAKLSEQEKLKPFYFRSGETVAMLEGTGYRLPTEAEWEFACRAGTTTRYWIGDKDEALPAAGWFRGSSGGRTHAVGELKANPLGLYDIHGNVWEWVQDWWEPTYYGQFQEKPALDPSGPASSGSQRVLRGGDWHDDASACRASNRFASDPTGRANHIGFRAALAVGGVRAAIAKEKTPDKEAVLWHGWPADAPKPAIAPFDAAQAKQHQQEWATYLNVPVERENTIGMKFVLIPPGEFLMGSTPEEIAAALKDIDPNDKRGPEYVKSEGPQHKVILTQPIYLGVKEVTQAEYEKVMGVNPSHFAPMGMGKKAVAGKETASHPVEMVSWNDAAEFCAKLSQQEKLKPFYFRSGETITPLDGTGYRLPTEAEWESACRAGTTTRFWSGDADQDLVSVGWFGNNSGGRTHAAGESRANPFGLSDVHGNVWEWVQDSWDPVFYGKSEEDVAINPSSLFSAGSQRVLRGGYWLLNPSRCRSSNRTARDPSSRNANFGFRVLLVAESVHVSRL